MERTRARIIDTARRLIPNAADLSVDEIASQAEVSVQTLYSHFGSKRGLLLAVIDTLQRDVGLYGDFDAVWSSPDGETALRRMLGATIRLWDRAWPLVAFTERVRRTDPEIRRYMAEVDSYRHSNLLSITERLSQECRLRSELNPKEGADLLFALTIPAVYEDLVVAKDWPLKRTIDEVTRTAIAAAIDPSTSPVREPPADWSSALHPSTVSRVTPSQPDNQA